MADVIWCSNCKEDLFEIKEVELDKEKRPGVFANDLVKLGEQEDNKVCETCGNNLERKQ